MAITNPNSLVNVSTLNYFKTKYTSDVLAPESAKAIKAVTYANNTLNFFKSEDTTGTADYTINLPEEMYLDATKTTIVNNFTWSDTTYPGSTNPNLDGKPVIVFAVKGDSATTYSFASLESLIAVYTGEATATAATAVSSDNKITVNVKVSTETGNVLTSKDDGLFVPETALTFATEGDIDGLFTA